MGDWLGVNWRPFGPSCEVPGTDNGCVTVCPLCNAIWSVDNAQSGFPKKRRCNTGSFNSLVYPKRRLSLPKVRAYGGVPCPSRHGEDVNSVLSYSRQTVLSRNGNCSSLRYSIG